MLGHVGGHIAAALPGGGASLDIGDIGYFSANPGAGYLSPNGQIVKQSDYPALVDKLPLVAQSANLGNGILPTTDNPIRMFRYQSQIFVVVDAPSVATYFGRVFVSNNNGASYSSFRQDYLLSMLPYAADSILYIRQTSSNVVSLYYYDPASSAGEVSGMSSVGSPSGYGSDKILRNPVTGNFLCIIGNKVYRSSSAKGIYTQVQTLSYYVHDAAFSDDGVCLLIATGNTSFVSADDFSTYSQVALPSPQGLANSNGHTVIYDGGVWLVGGQGRVLRTINPFSAAAWTTVFQNTAQQGAYNWSTLAMMGGVVYVGSTSGAILESVDAGQTFSFSVPNTYCYFVGRGTNSFIRQNGQQSGGSQHQLLRFLSYPGIQLPLNTGARTDGKAAYLKAA